VLAKRQAAAAVALYRLGQPEAVWPLLQCSPEPRLRSFLIQQLPALGADPGALIAQLNRELERETDAGIKRALVLSLGEHSKEQLPAETRATLTERLLRAYWTDPDPGFHSAAEWLLRRWGLKEQLRTSEEALAAQDPSPDRNWYVNRHGQTLAVIRGPTDFRMGSPVYEPEREAGEEAHFRRIPRSFALATKEITFEQYRQLDEEAEPVEPYSPEWDGPMIWITWFKAAQYCNWLTIKEGMDKSQRCYEPNDKGKYAEGMRVKPDHLHLTGYRLPTEAEWELACRAGAVTSRFYGSAEELLGRYATAPVNSRDHAVAVGLRLPNDLGMFDMYGNAWEWCQDAVKRPYKIANPWRVIEDIEDPIKEISLEPRVLRGGAFDTRSPSLRSATRFRGRPGDADQMVGLRVARTIK
jgi:formylglycine-generating enzyme required for sulfatase activity